MKRIEVENLDTLMDEKFIFTSLLNGSLVPGADLAINFEDMSVSYKRFAEIRTYYSQRFNILLYLDDYTFRSTFRSTFWESINRF